MPQIRLMNINKDYNNSQISLEDSQFCFNNINLTIHNGEFLSIVGASGSGKTTLLKLICGILKPDSGKVLEDEIDITYLPVERRKYAFVSQQPLLFPNMRVLDNVCFGLKMQGVPKALRIKKAKDMLERLELKGLEGRFPSELSGGQSQRVSIARALVSEPKVLLMDEPFSALNEELREAMGRLILELHRDIRLTTVFVTHQREEALYLSDRIIEIKANKLCEPSIVKVTNQE